MAGLYATAGLILDRRNNLTSLRYRLVLLGLAGAWEEVCEGTGLELLAGAGRVNCG